MANCMGGATIIVQLEVDQKRKKTLKENKNYSTMKAFLTVGEFYS